MSTFKIPHMETFSMQASHSEPREADTTRVTDGIFPHLEDKIGQTPVGYNGYRVKKTIYSKNIQRGNSGAAATDVFTKQRGIFTFKMDRCARGFMAIKETKTTSGGTVSTPAGFDFLNEDQQGGDQSTGLSNGNRLTDGDIVLGAILTVQDNRKEDNKDGVLYGGFVAGKTTVFDATSIYGHTADTFQSDLNTFRIGAKLERACSATTRMSVCQLAQKDALYRFSSVAADQDAGAPFLGVGIDGIVTSSDAIRAELTIYSLAAITVNDAPAGSSSKATFNLDDITCMYVTDNVYYS
uniref:Uncharacterized protein n=1 Tax=viral metagenome TaxID=1070528 RepID=A0A2V0RBZ7_9ZZZZ